MKTIGFVGLGGIGRPMAERLLQIGFDLIVCDLREVALEPFRQAGVRGTTKPTDCAAADMVIVMVADDAQVLAVIEGENGLAGGIDPGAPPLVAVMSTVLPETIETVAQVLAQRNCRTIDAPVSGGAARAAYGDLSIIAGGDEADIAAMAPALEALGTRIFHCGALGSGEAVKILNNMMAVTVQFLMMELVQVGERLGIACDLLSRVMEASSGRNYITADLPAQMRLLAQIGSDPALTRSHIAICRKDLHLAQTLAAQKQVFTPLLDGIAAGHHSIDPEHGLMAWKRSTEGNAISGNGGAACSI